MRPIQETPVTLSCDSEGRFLISIPQKAFLLLIRKTAKVKVCAGFGATVKGNPFLEDLGGWLWWSVGERGSCLLRDKPTFHIPVSHASGFLWPLPGGPAYTPVIRHPSSGRALAEHVPGPGFDPSTTKKNF